MSRPLYQQTGLETLPGDCRPRRRMSADERRALLAALSDEQLARFIFGAESQGWRWAELKREQKRRKK